MENSNKTSNNKILKYKYGYQSFWILISLSFVCALLFLSTSPWLKPFEYIIIIISMSFTYFNTRCIFSNILRRSEIKSNIITKPLMIALYSFIFLSDIYNDNQFSRIFIICIPFLSIEFICSLTKFILIKKQEKKDNQNSVIDT